MKARPRERELRLLVFRRFAPGDGFVEGLRDRLVDHALDAPDLVVAGKGQLVVGAGVVVEMGEREGEQRQRVLPGYVSRAARR